MVHPSCIYLLKVHNGNGRTLYGVCERRRSGVLIVKFEQISHIVLALSLLTLNKYMSAGNNGIDKYLLKFLSKGT